MDAKESVWKKEITVNSTIMALVKSFITVWAISGDPFFDMVNGDAFSRETFLRLPDGWGMNALFIFLGVGTVYYLVKDKQKSPWVSEISAFFAISTAISISYSETQSWGCVFGNPLRSAVALLVILGYYFAYKNGILFAAWLFEKNPHLLRREPVSKIELFLFQKHPFSGQLLFLFITALPWLVFFCPGTLQADSGVQLWIFFKIPGAIDYAGQHPVILTQIMGGCVWLGRQLFHSDTIGIFFYTLPQFTVQILTFAYAGFVLRRLKVPVLLNWAALLYWGVYPFFPIWGYTMVKDTPFYIFILLHLVSLLDVIVCNQKTQAKWWQIGVFLLSIAGICLVRNDGQYVVLAALLGEVFLYRRRWKLYAAGAVLCLSLVFGIDYIYKPLHHITAAGAHMGDMLSIPLQQTARYLTLHLDDVTEEEAEILQGFFAVPLEEISQWYVPRYADPMESIIRQNLNSMDLKSYLSEDLNSYFKVWFQQFLRHPDTYVQAFLNHNYVYFYPDEYEFVKGLQENAVTFDYLGDEQRYYDGHFDIRFAIWDGSGRQILKDFYYTVDKMPLFGMLKSAGLQVYFLLGECVYLLAKKQRREILFFVPGLFVLLIRLFSPVACVRYVLPIMAALPVTAAWCYSVTHKKEISYTEPTYCGEEILP